MYYKGFMISRLQSIITWKCGNLEEEASDLADKLIKFHK